LLCLHIKAIYHLFLRIFYVKNCFGVNVSFWSEESQVQIIERKWSDEIFFGQSRFSNIYAIDCFIIHQAILGVILCMIIVSLANNFLLQKAHHSIF